MRTIPISEIVILPNRQRQEFEPEALQELITSIEDRGLMHPPVLRMLEGKWTLVAGERRLKAMSEILELGGQFTYDHTRFDAARMEIPFASLGELDELEAEEAELDENLKRRDLSWQELASAHDRLHKLRQKQKPRVMTISSESDPDDPALNKTFVVGSTHTIADTAKEIHGRSDGDYQNQVRKELIVAKHLDNPLIAKAKSTEEAFKILKRDEERQKNIALAATVGETFNSSVHQLLKGDCLELMKQFADGPEADKFDVILTDPPYGMGAQDFGDAGGKMTGIEHHYDDSHEAWEVLMGGWSEELGDESYHDHDGWADLAYKSAKQQAHAYVFCDIDRFHQLKDFMERAGWYVFRTPFIIHKLNSGRVPLPDRGPRRSYEILLYAIKGNKPVTHIYPDVIPCNGDENLGHGAQKPVELYANLLQRSVRPGDRVLDSFAGSGTIFPAAHAFQCTAVGIEQDAGSYGICLKRLQSLKELETPSIIPLTK